MRGQLSLEFLVVLAVYLAFIGALVSAQIQYINNARFASTKSQMRAVLLSIEGTEQAVNNRYTYVSWADGNCTIVGRLVLCGAGNSMIEIPLGYSEMSINGQRYLS
jgi:uncharacterized protein (UPF0333 family)